MTCRLLKSSCAIFVVMAHFFSNTHGELPPAVYKDLQDKSPGEEKTYVIAAGGYSFRTVN